MGNRGPFAAYGKEGSALKKILIVEDDTAIRRELETLLTNAGYKALTIENFTDILLQIIKAEPDMVLLDINLPEINGEILLRELRKQADIPVIMVTSRTSEVDEVLSMSYGADDYITKPYNPTILLLRIQALFRRFDYAGEVTTYKDLTVNLAKGMLSRGEEELYLTKNEMLIFQMLLQNGNRIVSRDALMTNLWDNNEFINDNALTVNISRLRAKLREFGCGDAIETRKKQGYVLNL